MNDRRTHTRDDLYSLEAATGLRFGGWLDLGCYLVPIFVRADRSADDARTRVLRLNNRAV